MKIGLRICVNTLRGVMQGVPALLKLFDEYNIQASFFFATSPDKSGRLVGRVLQPWYRDLDIASRCYGVGLPPPLIYQRAEETMRSVASAGHETGILCHDRSQWLSKIAHADEEWTRQELSSAIDAYGSVFGEKPKSIAAAGWQVNPHLLKLEQMYGFDYACDVRGKTAFFPVLQQVESNCPQIPTTLPTLNELLIQEGEITPDNVHQYLYAESLHILPQGQVYSCDAEMEGMAYLHVMEKLIVMWKGAQGGIQPLNQLIDEEILPDLAKHQIGWAPDPSEKVYFATQSVKLED